MTLEHNIALGCIVLMILCLGWGVRTVEIKVDRLLTEISCDK